jgi:hypothetical protein
MSPTSPTSPWHNRPSIFNHIQTHLDEEGRLTKDGYELPDEALRNKDKPLRFAAGAMDGVFSHHVGPEETEKEATRMANLIKIIAEEDSLEAKTELYPILQEDGLVGLIDPTLQKMVEDQLPIQPYLHNYARWLAFESPDRGAVKLGIAILGLIQDREDMDRILTLGKHEEFTLFAAVALTNAAEDPETQLWELAQFVDGWGKIHIVERLSGTEDPQIKKWLLREGYKNSIMYEYLAYTCAVNGELKKELSEPAVDKELLRGAGDIIEALINGGPAENIDDYADGSEVASLYVAHMKQLSEYELRDFLVLQAIQRFLNKEEPQWGWRGKNGWTEDLKANLLIDLHELLGRPHWRQLVLDAQSSEVELEQWWASSVARALGMDMWDVHWKRLSDNPTKSVLWYQVMEDLTEERLDQIVSLAIEELPLDEIAAGPANESGIIGPQYEPHRCLDFILQNLGPYPGKGIELIRVALRSSTTRNRNMALRALSEWGKEQWPEEMEALLEKVVVEEPNEHTQENMNKVLRGDKID